MSINISYKSSSFKPKSGNLIFFVNEKYSPLGLKKHLTKYEYEFIDDVIKSQNLSKKIISIDLSSKKKIFLISTEKNATTSQVENLGADFFNYLKNFKQKDFIVNSDVIPANLKNFVGYFLHGLKLKSYNFEKYKSKKNKNNISIHSVIDECYI